MDLTFPSSNDPTMQRLERDWHRLRHDRHALRRAATWPLPGGAPTSLDEVLVRSGYGGRTDDDVADAYLGRLVAVALDDDLAARVVVQRLVPALFAMARRRELLAKHRGDALLDELLGTAWIVIRTFPVHRRPHRVAAGLVWDCQYLQFTRPARLRSTLRETPVPPALVLDELEPAESPDEPDPIRVVLDVLVAARAGGVDEHDVELLVSMARGETSAEQATRQGVSDRAVRYRRAAALARVRELVAA